MPLEDREIGLQDVLREAYLTRSNGEIDALFELCCVDVFDAMNLSLNRCSSEEGFVLLDAGCGSAKAIEGYVGVLKKDNLQMGDRIKGIGLDLNPRTDLLSNSVQSDIRQGDVCAMPIDDNSVNFAYSAFVLIYVADVLKAFEEGYRVLKPGGQFFWDIQEGMVSYFPSFKDILKLTPGGDQVFKYYPSRINAEGAGAVVCTKVPGVEFKGFNYEMVDSVARYGTGVLNHRSFLREAIYRSLWTPELNEDGNRRARGRYPNKRFNQFLDRVIFDAKAARFPIRSRSGDCEAFDQFPMRLNALWESGDIEGVRREIANFLRISMEL